MRKSVLVVLVGMVLTGCAGGTVPVPTAPVATSVVSVSASPSPTAVEPGEVYQLPADRDVAAWGDPIASKVGTKLTNSRYLSREGWRVDLMGVYRLSDDRVLARFRLNADHAVRSDMTVWQDPAFDWWFHLFDRRNGGYGGYVTEFSDVQLAVPGDQTSYRAVRTPTNFCLCSVSAADPKGYGDLPAYVVLSAPKDATSVNLSLRDVGTFADIPVSAAVPATSVVPLGFGYQVRLQSVTRPVAGGVHVRFSLEVPAAGVAGTTFNFHAPYQIDKSPWRGTTDFDRALEGLVSVTPDGVWGGWPKTSNKESCASCTNPKNYFVSQPGTGMDLEIDLPDPGTPEVMVALTGAWPFSAVAVDGTPTRSDALVHYRSRTVTTGATISDGDIDLDTAVLFMVDKATLTSKANAVLDRAAVALRAQSGRSLVVVGHTDSTGTAAHNLDLSRRRAEAVRVALAERLGAGWTFAVEGRGESDPEISEVGLSGDRLARARAANRSVEVTVK